MNVTYREEFKTMVQEQVNNLPEAVKTTVLNQVDSIYTKANVLDQDTTTLNDQELSNAQTIIDVLIDAAKAQHAEKTNKKPAFGLESELKDGSKFTKELEKYKALQTKYDELSGLINSRAQDLGLHEKENYFKKSSDKKLVAMCNQQDEIKAQKDKIYAKIEEAVKKSPEGTRFQCGEYVIAHQRAYTDVDGVERMLVFENLY